MFRHTFASRLAQDGVDIVTVKELLGYTNISCTMRYVHSNDEAKHRVVRRLSTSGCFRDDAADSEWEELSREKTVFDSIAGWYPNQYNYAESGEPAVFTACMTTASLFEVFAFRWCKAPPGATLNTASATPRS